MREILFKAKRIDNGKWVEGYYCKWLKGERIITYSEKETDCIITWMSNGGMSRYEVDPETICQFTGLLDKNGNKIWENDIFKFNDEVWESSYTSCGMEYDSWEVENYGVVGYYKETARYDFCRYKYNENSVEAELHENHDIEFADFVSGLEVIGNIFDNSELLEGGVKNE